VKNGLVLTLLRTSEDCQMFRVRHGRVTSLVCAILGITLGRRNGFEYKGREFAIAVILRGQIRLHYARTGTSL